MSNYMYRPRTSHLGVVLTDAQKSHLTSLSQQQISIIENDPDLVPQIFAKPTNPSALASLRQQDAKSFMSDLQKMAQYLQSVIDKGQGAFVQTDFDAAMYKLNREIAIFYGKWIDDPIFVSMVNWSVVNDYQAYNQETTGVISTWTATPVVAPVVVESPVKIDDKYIAPPPIPGVKPTGPLAPGY